FPMQAEVLITPQEAQLPADTTRTKDVIRGPRVDVASPAPNAGTTTSPLFLKIKFEAHGGAKIDVDSVQITYLRLPPVDLTQRVRPFIKPNGIEMPNAEVPPGIHSLQIDVKDTAERSTKAYITFTVTK